MFFLEGMDVLGACKDGTISMISITFAITSSIVLKNIPYQKLVILRASCKYVKLDVAYTLVQLKCQFRVPS
jgi:hypothetical protein